VAQLPEACLGDVAGCVMRELSVSHTLIPASKAQVTALVTLIDEHIETTEAAIIQALPTGDVKTWLIDNAGVGRQVMAQVLMTRKAEL
jgi:hypothetical protein